MGYREWEDIDHDLDVPFEGSTISDADTVDPLGLGGTSECVHYWLYMVLTLMRYSLRGVDPETSRHRHLLS